MTNTLDTQQVELIATASLERELVKNGFEVAHPNRDRGIDLIVYSDQENSPFKAVPIQIKSARKKVFSIHKKYKDLKGLIFAYIWEVETTPRIFLMTYTEALDLMPEKAKLSASWQEKGHYAYNKVPKHLEQSLALYEDRWQWFKQHLEN